MPELTHIDSGSAALLCRRLLGRPASESGTLCRGDGAHGRGERRRKNASVGYPHPPTIYSADLSCPT